MITTLSPRRCLSHLGLALVLAGVLTLTSCKTAPGDQQPQTHRAAPFTPMHSLSDVDNAIEVSPGLISGSAPESEASFRSLAAIGIKTIISVDGATPNIESAHKHHMRYVHLPIGYHGIDHDRQLEIAQACRDLPGPIYVHCHHGKHRGPAAAATAAVLLDIMTVDDAVAFMHQAGTSKNYPGLYDCVESLEPAMPDQLKADASQFPEVAPVPEFAQAMVAAQTAFDHLAKIRDAKWQTPAEHPDLTPVAEAGQLENLLRALAEDPGAKNHPADFQQMMTDAWQASRDLELSLRSVAPPSELNQRFKVVGGTCKACHIAYRNRH